MIVVRLTADQPGQYSGAIRLKDAHLTEGVTDGQNLSFKGQLENGLGYEAQAVVLHEGGSMEAAAPGKLRFNAVDSITVMISMGTDYAADINKDWRG